MVVGWGAPEPDLVHHCAHVHPLQLSSGDSQPGRAWANAQLVLLNHINRNCLLQSPILEHHLDKCLKLLDDTECVAGICNLLSDVSPIQSRVEKEATTFLAFQTVHLEPTRYYLEDINKLISYFLCCECWIYSCNQVTFPLKSIFLPILNDIAKNRQTVLSFVLPLL